jgi:hypothetical protein
MKKLALVLLLCGCEADTPAAARFVPQYQPITTLALALSDHPVALGWRRQFQGVLWKKEQAKGQKLAEELEKKLRHGTATEALGWEAQASAEKLLWLTLETQGEVEEGEVQGMTFLFGRLILMVVVDQFTGFRRSLLVECYGDFELAHSLGGLAQDAFQVEYAAARGRWSRGRWYRPPYLRRRTR